MEGAGLSPGAVLIQMSGQLLRCAFGVCLVKKQNEIPNWSRVSEVRLLNKFQSAEHFQIFLSAASPAVPPLVELQVWTTV